MIEQLNIEAIFAHYREILEKRVPDTDLITTELQHYYRSLIEEYHCTKMQTEEMKRYDELLFNYFEDYKFQQFVKKEGEFLLPDALNHLEQCKEKFESEKLKGMKTTQWL